MGDYRIPNNSSNSIGVQNTVCENECAIRINEVAESPVAINQNVSENNEQNENNEQHQFVSGTLNIRNSITDGQTVNSNPTFHHNANTEIPTISRLINSTEAIVPQNNKCECVWRKRNLGEVPPCYICSSTDLPPPYVQKENKNTKLNIFRKFFGNKNIVTEDMLQSRPSISYQTYLSHNNLIRDTDLSPPRFNNSTVTGLSLDPMAFMYHHSTQFNRQSENLHPNCTLSRLREYEEQQVRTTDYNSCDKHLRKIVYAILLSIMLTLLTLSGVQMSLEFLSLVIIIAFIVLYPFLTTIENLVLLFSRNSESTPDREQNSTNEGMNIDDTLEREQNSSSEAIETNEIVNNTEGIGDTSDETNCNLARSVSSHQNINYENPPNNSESNYEQNYIPYIEPTGNPSSNINRS